MASMSRRVLAALSLSLFAPASTPAHGRSSCGPAVSRRGHVIRVVPVDAARDTANLQCAFDLASASPGSTVELAAGTFVSDVVFIDHFVGEVRGEGENETLVTNVPFMSVNENWWNSGSPPGPDNVYPQVWTFTEGRFSVRDMKFKASGGPTSGWVVPGTTIPPIAALVAEVAVTGLDVHAEFSHVTFEAERSPTDPFYGYDSYSSVLFTGFPWGPTPAPGTGSLLLHHCSFRTTAAGPALMVAADSHFLVADNDYDDVFDVLGITGLQRSTALYSGNRARNSLYGTAVDFSPTLGFESSLLIVDGNRFQVSNGLGVLTTFSGGSACVITDNWIDPPSAGITLGNGTSHCLVAHNHGATVVDDGTGNHIVP